MDPVDTSRQLITTIEPGQVVLNNLPLTINGGVTFELTNITGHKIQQGDPGPDDHPYNSTIIQRNYMAGGQALVSQGDQDKDAYWDSNADTEHLETLALPPAVTAFTGPNSNQAIVLGQFPQDANARVIAAWGDRLCQMNIGGTAFVDTAGFTSETPLPIKATNYAPPGLPGSLAMYIPCGASYHIWDGSTLTRQALSAVSFVVWQQKLFRLSQDGTVSWINTTNPADWQEIGNLPGGENPRRLVIFYDRNNETLPHVTTSRSVYALDFDDALLLETDLYYPKHSRVGPAVMWRSDLYLAGGLGVLRQSNGFVDAVGPDHKFGLPKQLAGYICDMEAAFNQYFALIVGQVAAGVDEHDAVDLRLGGEETMEGTTAGSLSSLHSWNGLGWTKYWQGDGLATTVFVANPTDSYTVWWAAGGKVYKRPLPMDYYNPRETVPFPLELQAEHITSRYNWGWINIQKTLKEWECVTRNLTDLRNIEVYYRVDDEEAPWTYLTTLTSGRRQTIKFGVVTWDGLDLHYSQPHEWVQFRYVLNADPAERFTSPVIEWWAAVGRKFLKPQRVWHFQVDLRTAHRGMSEEAMIEWLEAIVTQVRSVPFVHKKRLYMVDVTVLTGGDQTGNETTSLRTISLIETTEVV